VPTSVCPNSMQPTKPKAAHIGKDLEQAMTSGSSGQGGGECSIEDKARQVVLLVGLTDAALFSMPAMLLAAPQQREEACGWTTGDLGYYCLGAAACLWFSIAVVAAQAISLSGCFGQNRGAVVARHLGWHLLWPWAVA